MRLLQLVIGSGSTKSPEINQPQITEGWAGPQGGSEASSLVREVNQFILILTEIQWGPNQPNFMAGEAEAVQGQRGKKS